MKHPISAEGTIYQTLYYLHRHYLFGWTLIRWAVLLLIATPMLALVGILPGGQLVFAALGLVTMALLLLIWQVRQRGYLRFKPDEWPNVEHISAQPLPFPYKIPIRVSGTFAVGSKERYFVEETAFFQSFETRERVIMVNIPFTRLGWVFPSHASEVGWWYTFFTSGQINTIHTGWLYFGPHPRPAIRITLHPNNSTSPQYLYLTVDKPEHQQQILADLKAA